MPIRDGKGVTDGNVCSWHFPDVPACQPNVRSGVDRKPPAKVPAHCGGKETMRKAALLAFIAAFAP
jgi:hypothetical protein